MQFLDSGYPINCAVSNRYNDYRKKLEADVLALSVSLPQISMVSHTPLSVAKQKTFAPAEHILYIFFLLVFFYRTFICLQ